MSDKVVFEYNESLNPDGRYIDGVPLRDLTQDDLDKLTQHQIDGVMEYPFYVKVGRMQHKRDDAAAEQTATPATETPKRASKDTNS